MEKKFREFCRYYLTNKDKKEYQRLSEICGENFKKYQKKALKYTKNITKKAQKLGYNSDFESFCEILEEYVSKKSSLNDEQKRIYLETLMPLSQIYDVNLREELERYSVTKKNEKPSIDEKKLFIKLCRMYINPKSKPLEITKIANLVQDYNVDFEEINQKASMLAEEIKGLVNKMGYDTSKKSLYKMIDEYNLLKPNMSEEQKIPYLKVLLYLSEIYNINLKEIFLNIQQPSPVNNDLHDLFNNLTNPLENKELLTSMLSQRYDSGSFNINSLYLSTDNLVKEQETHNFNIIQADLTYTLFQIFLEKFNNYAYDDLNPKYTNLITENDLQKLSSLTKEELYNIINEINKGEKAHYFSKKYNITLNLYDFIYLSVSEGTNFKANIIGNKESSFFVNNTSNNIMININGPEEITYQLLSEYIKKCALNNLNYEMSPFNYNGDEKNRTILYANKQDLISKINILDKILEDNPDWLNKFGSPISMCSKLTSPIYAISELGLLDKSDNLIYTYSEYIDSISEISYYRVIAKMVINKIEEPQAKEIIKDFISLNNIIFPDDSYKNPLLALYNGKKFVFIKDLINQYIPLISNTFNTYMQDNKEKSILTAEFKKTLQYLSNIIYNKNQKENNNISINSLI